MGHLTITTDEDTSVNINTGAYSFIFSATALNGTVAINTDNTLTYTPHSNFNGADTITYNEDGTDGNFFTETIGVTVNNVNDLPVLTSGTQIGSVIEDDVDASSVSGQVVATDVEGVVTYASTGSASYGTFAVDAITGEWTYNIDSATTQSLSVGETKTETFSVTATDSDGTAVSQDVVVTVAGTNDAPVATADTITTGSKTLSTYDLTGVFKMKDANGDVVGPDDNTVAGSLNIDQSTGEGTISMTSIQPFFGFTWTASDITFTQNADTTYTANMTFTWMDYDTTVTMDFDATFNADGTASIVAIDGPGNDGIVGNPLDNGIFLGFNVGFDFVLTNQTDEVVSAAILEDNPLNNIVVLDNDPDVDGDTLTVTDATAANGTVTINADNTLNYLGNTDYNGPEAITYTISDGNDGTDTATVTFDVASVNDRPVANNDTSATNEDTTVTIDVLTNDTDVDGDALTVTGATATNGTVTINADSTLAYQGNQDFNGTDTITYTVSDGELNSTATTTVTVNSINDAPVATDDSTTNTSFSFSNGTFGMYDGYGSYVGGATDVTGSFVIDFTTGLGVGELASNSPFFGNLWNAHDVAIQLSADGTTAELNMFFDWGATSNIFVTLDVAVTMVNGEITSFETLDGPGADGTAGNPMDNGPFNGFSVAFSATNIDTLSSSSAIEEDIAYNNIVVLDNDFDVDGDVLTVTTATATNGTVTINADNTLNYLGDTNFNGIDTITYTVSDGMLSDTATVNVTVHAANDTTTVVNTTATVDEDSSILLDLTANATDIDGDELVVTSASALNGNIDTNGNYTPNADFNGTDTITYTVNDSEPATVTVTVTVNNTSEVPTSEQWYIEGPYIISELEAFSFNTSFAFNDADEGDVLTYSAKVQLEDDSYAELPNWLSIDSQTGVLSGTPSVGDRTTLPVLVTTNVDNHDTWLGNNNFDDSTRWGDDFAWFGEGAYQHTKTVIDEYYEFGNHYRSDIKQYETGETVIRTDSNIDFELRVKELTTTNSEGVVIEHITMENANKQVFNDNGESITDYRSYLKVIKQFDNNGDVLGTAIWQDMSVFYYSESNSEEWLLIEDSYGVILTPPAFIHDFVNSFLSPFTYDGWNQLWTLKSEYYDAQGNLIDTTYILSDDKLSIEFNEAGEIIKQWNGSDEYPVIITTETVDGVTTTTKTNKFGMVESSSEYMQEIVWQ